MAEILLAAINASFGHTNIAVRSIALYCQKKLSKGNSFICFDEWTINQQVSEILRGIIAHKPKIVMFSAYIWNIEIAEKIIKNLKSYDETLAIGAGGPEVSYNPQEIFDRLPQLDFICVGEGEETVCEIAENFENQKEFRAEDFLRKLKNVRGLYLKNENSVAEFTGEREPIKDLAQLVFPYPEISEPDNKIYYYESSRGCPFSCSYCLSSLDKRVRFMPLERVKNDLQFFLDNGVKLVKFVDRTFNLDESRYIEIWNYILNNRNGKTTFHFEIEAEYLSENALNFLQKVPPGIMQFEIGVQSANQETLKAVSRSSEILKLAENIKKIPKTIKRHLDLIAGLPYEDLQSFGRSFDFVMATDPDELQLGFLKALYGTQMKNFAAQNGWKLMKTPPYEILSAPDLSYDDVCFLKDLEIVLNAYYNSRNFEKCMNCAKKNYGFWNFFAEITALCQKEGVFSAARSERFWFDFLAKFAKSKNDRILYEVLRFDFVKTGKKGGFPDWYVHFYDKNSHRAALEKTGGVKNSRIDFAYSEYEEFEINPLSENPSETGKTKILFYYENKFNAKKSEQIIIDFL